MDASAKPIGTYSRRVQNQNNFIPDVAQFFHPGFPSTLGLINTE
jgi:hypothetical protein